jgi:hypothetical protein
MKGTSLKLVLCGRKGILSRMIVLAGGNKTVILPSNSHKDTPLLTARLWHGEV